jgi:hypothetical protein
MPTDDCWAEFTYKGYPFWIDSPFSFIWIHGENGKVPQDIFNEVEAHIRKINPWNIFEFPSKLAFGIKCILKPMPKFSGKDIESKQ